MAKIDPKASIQIIEMEQDDLKFKSPFQMCISGASMSGKSEFIVKLIVHRAQVFNVTFQQLFYCQPESLTLRHNPIYAKIKDSFPSAQLVTGLPDINMLNLNLDTSHKLVVIDDLMDPFLNSEAMVKLLSADCHHFNISVIFTLQNFFARSRFGKTLSRNVTYRCVFYNRLDLTEIRTISIQICHEAKFLVESFQFLRKEYPNEPAYIIIDGHGGLRFPELFVKSQIFPQSNNSEIKPIFFFPKT